MFSWLLPLAASAADYQAGELTYEVLGNTRYRVKLRLYRDCAGPAFEPSLTLSCRVGSAAAACASTDARNFTAPLTLTGVPMLGNPYCAQTPVPGTNQCGPNAPINYESAIFQADVTLPPAAEWTLSVDAGTRPPVANLQGAATQPLRLQATLRNQLTLADGSQQLIQNTSAQYQGQDVSVPFACASQRTTLTFSTYEPDGDSLVYSLEQPLYGCGQPAGYAVFAPGGALPPVLQANGQTCTPQLPTGAAITYSAQFPLPSYSLAGNCPAQQATSNFRFDATLGSFTFTPVYFAPFAPTDRSRNSYAVVGRVTEYRLVGGRYYEVGAINRNLLVVVLSCEQFQYPNHALQLGPMQIYGSTRIRPLTDLVQVAPGQSTGVVVRATDPDGVHQSTLTARWLNNYPVVLPPLQVIQRGPSEIGVEFAPPASLPEGLYYAGIRAEDDACPRRSFANDTIRFYVNNRPLAAGAAQAAALTTASPNPFTDAVTFRFGDKLAGPVTLEITNLLGQVVTRLALHPATDGSAPTTTWRPAPELPTGVYLARVPATSQTLRLLRR
jgi:hypothetical protein